MSSGYTSAFAMTAPAEPAIALPHGGKTSTLDCPAIVVVDYLEEAEEDGTACENGNRARGVAEGYKKIDCSAELLSHGNSTEGTPGEEEETSPKGRRLWRNGREPSRCLPSPIEEHCDLPGRLSSSEIGRGSMAGSCQAVRHHHAPVHRGVPIEGSSAVIAFL